VGIVCVGVCIVAMSTSGVDLLWLFMTVVSLLLVFGPLIDIYRRRK
jgi:hypothetical protein